MGVLLVAVLTVGLFAITPTKAQSPVLTKSMTLKTLLPKQYAKVLVMEKWESKAEFTCLARLWGKESAWNYKAKSPTNDYGIPQRNMPRATKAQIAKFLANHTVQIDWGVGYIKHRYGSPCEAWKFWERRNWY